MIKENTYTWIVIEPIRENLGNREYWWPARLGWWLGKKCANFRKSYGGTFFNIRRPLVVLLTSFIEANLETR